MWHSWLPYIPLSHMALCVFQGPEVSVQQRTWIWVLPEINSKYGPQYFHECWWIWADPWNKRDALQKWDCRAWQRNHADTNPWILVPGTCYLGLKHNQHCWFPSHVGTTEDPFKHCASLTNPMWQFKERRCSSTLHEYLLFLCQRLRNCMCISSKPSIMSRLTSLLAIPWDLAK